MKTLMRALALMLALGCAPLGTALAQDKPAAVEAAKDAAPAAAPAAADEKKDAAPAAAAEAKPAEAAAAPAAPRGLPVGRQHGDPPVVVRRCVDQPAVGGVALRHRCERELSGQLAQGRRDRPRIEGFEIGMAQEELPDR